VEDGPVVNGSLAYLQAEPKPKKEPKIPFKGLGVPLISLEYAYSFPAAHRSYNPAQCSWLLIVSAERRKNILCNGELELGIRKINAQSTKRQNRSRYLDAKCRVFSGEQPVLFRAWIGIPPASFGSTPLVLFVCPREPYI